MKYWWQNVVKEYFTFSAKERKGLMMLFLVAAVIFLFSRYFPVEKTSLGKDAFQKELAELKITVDSSRSTKNYEHGENYTDYSRPGPNDYANKFKGESFYFDPNSLDAAGWEKLGVRDKTVNTIQKFLASGFTFRQPDDIKKIYGLRKDEAERLIPYIRIAQKEPAANPYYTENKNTTSSASPAFESKKKVIDVNTADTSEFISLPGIGSKLAARIVNFRQKLGGFASVEQLGETYGIPDSTFQKIKPRLQCSHPALKTININTADINELRAHPYLRWNIANAIINYRQQHGNYKSAEDIKKIDIITDELYNKISPYLSL